MPDDRTVVDEMARQESLAEAEVERRVAAKVRQTLPATWRVTESVGRPDGPDLVIEIEAPDGRRTRLIVEVKQLVERRDVAGLNEQLRRLVSRAGDVPVVGARYLSSSVRDALTEAGLSYVDATGNMRIAGEAPALFLSDRGEDRDPWRKGRPPGTLKGEPAARVVRTLLDCDRNWRVRELIKESGASNGATYRVLDYLQREDLLVKDGDIYRVTDWERLLRAWSSDAPFQSTVRTATFIEPRGVEYFLKKLSDPPAFPTAVTGSVAAREWATYAPAKAAYVYVASIPEAADQWELRANTAAPNVLLLEPIRIGDVPFRGTSTSSAGYPVAAPAQVAADLLNGPGREPVEAEFLIEWLKVNQEQWRRA